LEIIRISRMGFYPDERSLKFDQFDAALRFFPPNRSLLRVSSTECERAPSGAPSVERY